jgi:carboxymethylenebutenolidase
MKPAKPTRMKASDFHPYILEIFDGYVHGKMTKREFSDLCELILAFGAEHSVVWSETPA